MSDPDLSQVLLSLDMFLEPALVRDTALLAVVGDQLRSGRLVVIRNAFQAAFAQRMFRSLDTCAAWRQYEGYEHDFHFQHHNLYDPATFPDDLAWCRAIFDSADSRALAARLSGRDCSGLTSFSASWYQPGDHSLPHTDAVMHDDHRQVAFIWHLARDWRPEWGGALFWCPRNLYLPPSFNTLVLFNVGPESYHFVTQVSPYAQAKRLTINGWWTGFVASEARPACEPRRHLAGEAILEVY